MKFIHSVVAGFLASTCLLFVAFTCFLLLYVYGPVAVPPLMTKPDALILLLRMHYNTFLWVWVIIGVCMSILHRLAYVSLIVKRK
jgi:hypothetical protein